MVKQKWLPLAHVVPAPRSSFGGFNMALWPSILTCGIPSHPRQLIPTGMFFYLRIVNAMDIHNNLKSPFGEEFHFHLQNKGGLVIRSQVCEINHQRHFDSQVIKETKGELIVALYPMGVVVHSTIGLGLYANLTMCIYF
jgi:hypothetical protein